MHFSIRSFVFGMLAMLLLLIAAAAAVIWTGGFQVAASEPDTALGRWILHATFENSVARQASRGDPPAFTAAMIADGASEFKGTCQDCHGGIGVKPEGWSEGMRPNPPDLSKSVRDLSPAEVFWIIKHGVKMTGMPAFGKTHDDATIWHIAAFVKALPKMTPAQYAAYKVEQSDSGAKNG